MKARHRGLELQPGSVVYPILEIVFDWMEEQNGPLPDHAELLHRLRQAGFCFCETMFGCIACKGRQNMSRNQFENNGEDPIELSQEPAFVMPEPPDGYRYYFIPRDSGEVAVYLAVVPKKE